MDTGGFIAPTFGQRLGGRLLDGLVFVVPSLVAFAVLGAAGRAAVIALAAVYEVAFVATTGRSLGKIAAGTRVVDATASGPVPPRNAIVRYVVFLGPGVVFTALGLEFVAIAWGVVIAIMVLRPPLHRGAHDLAARTIVVPTRVTTPRHTP